MIEATMASSEVRDAGHSVSIRNLTKSYGGNFAIEGINLDVLSGEFVALLGPSGCGKTTLLRAIAGLVDPSAGEIMIAGTSVLRIPAAKRNIGFVFQNYALFPHMSVAENVGFGLRMRNVRNAEMATLVDEALELIRLSDYGARYPHELSGGEQQRVALARALVTKPKVLLLDEPLGALDAKLREQMQVELRDLQRRLRVTTIFVTHDQQEAMAMADRVAVMRRGRIDQFDAPRVIYKAPKTAFVAEFIGQMNRVFGEVVKAAPQRILIKLTNEAEIEAPLNDRLAVSDRVVGMVRPESLSIGARAGRTDCGNVLTGRVVSTVFTGDRSVCFVDTAVGQFQVQCKDDEDFAVDSTVVISWRPEDTKVFIVD